jgi:uncharacterized protein YdhG (YjbR/CyaY superfamily)
MADTSYGPGVEEYLNNVDPSQRKVLEEFRKLVKQLAPEAEETISYGVPTFKLGSKPLIYYAAYKNHMSIYPASDSMVEALGDQLAEFRASKGTLRFTESNPIPKILQEQIVLFRLGNIK